ncbi:hypothetical protein ACFE04_002215 [Oxalis oulophora]
MSSSSSMHVVRNLDVKRYMGRWYEIASFQSAFQPKNGENTRATYTLKDDGTINVLNETWSDGKRSYIQGIAYKDDVDSDEAKLKVKFYVPPFLPLFPVVGDYWVLYIDDDYHYAVVGQPSRKYLWANCELITIIGHLDYYGKVYYELILITINHAQEWPIVNLILSRKSHIDEEMYNQLVEKAKGEGYDVSKLHKTPHNDTPPEGDGPEDKKGLWWIKSLLGK